MKSKFPKRRLACAIGAVPLLILAMVACTPDVEDDPIVYGSACADRVKKSDESPLSEADTHTVHYSILIEVTDNSEESQDAIVREITPFIQCAVNEESYLRVAIDSGSGSVIETPPDLEGSTRLDELRNLEKVNDRGEDKAKEEAVTAIQSELRSAIANVEVGAYGSASRLLALAATEATDVPAGHAQVIILWSPLLGSSDDQADCLDVTDVPATDENAAAVVARCIDQSLLASTDVAGVSLLGAAYGSTDAEQQRFAGLLQQHLYSSVFGVSAKENQ